MAFRRSLMKVKGLGKPKDKIQIFEETVREARKYLPEQDVQDLLRHATAEDIEHTTSLLKAMTTATKALKKAEKSLGYVIQDHEEPEERNSHTRSIPGLFNNNLSEDEVAYIMKKHSGSDGNYMIIPSTTSLELVVSYTGDVKKYRIMKNPEETNFFISSERVFSTLQELIEAYKSSPLPPAVHGDFTHLVTPIDQDPYLDQGPILSKAKQVSHFPPKPDTLSSHPQTSTPTVKEEPKIPVPLKRRQTSVGYHESYGTAESMAKASHNPPPRPPKPPAFVASSRALPAETKPKTLSLKEEGNNTCVPPKPKPRTKLPSRLSVRDPVTSQQPMMYEGESNPPGAQKEIPSSSLKTKQTPSSSDTLSESAISSNSAFSSAMAPQPSHPMRQQSESNSFTSSRASPSLKALTLLKWKDQEKVMRTFRLADEVSGRWQFFGTLLGLSANRQEVWERENPKNITMCWNKVMEHWLTGESVDYPPTWEGMYTMLEDAELAQVAMSLKEAVEGNIYTT